MGAAEAQTDATVTVALPCCVSQPTTPPACTAHSACLGVLPTGQPAVQLQLTFPTMCRSVTMAMKARLPMITTCCTTVLQTGEAQRVRRDLQRRETGSETRATRACAYGGDLDAGGVVCVKAHHAVLQPAASLPGGAACSTNHRKQNKNLAKQQQLRTRVPLRPWQLNCDATHLASCALPGLRQLQVFQYRICHPLLPLRWTG